MEDLLPEEDEVEVEVQTEAEPAPEAASAALLNARREGRTVPAVDLPDTEAQLVARRQRVLGPAYRLFYQTPVHLVRGLGTRLYDPQGNAYLDCYNNVASVGHCHPRVVEALASQAATLATHTRYLHDNIVEYAERLTATLPEGLAVASFGCSGSEANSLMLRMARNHTGRDEAIVLDWAYHGTTQELIDLSPYKYKRKAGKGRAAHVFEAAVPDPYRAPEDWAFEDMGKRFAESVAEQIDSMRKQGKALIASSSAPSLVLDCSAVELSSSVGLSLLLAFSRDGQAAGKTLSVRGMPHGMREIAEVYGLGELLVSQ